MRTALIAHGTLPADDARAHCMAAGLIATHCSVTEAWLASLGKELLDLLGPGDAEWADLAADRRGIACARQTPSNAAFEACCNSSYETADRAPCHADGTR
jgi:hypothetical protein